MKILILGGTRFVGRHLVEAARARGHSLTLFNRGKSDPELFPEVERLTGDRDGGLDALNGRQWDAALDTCGYVPRIVRQSAEKLAGSVGHYTFISSISAYADFNLPGTTEDSPLATTETLDTEELTNATYGPLKVLCEQTVENALPGRSLIIRPGLIVGPHDPTDRFTYWPARTAKGGEILVPGSPQQSVQFIDARDLAEWTVRMVEAQAAGIYNAVGPKRPPTLSGFLTQCRNITNSDAKFTFVDENFCEAQEINPVNINCWAFREIWDVRADKALAAGLTYRPTEQTISDTLAWDAARPQNIPLKTGLEPERERDLLQAWHENADKADRPQVNLREGLVGEER